MATTLTRAPRNRTLILDEADRRRLRPRLSRIAKKARLPQLLDRTIFGDALEVLPFLPHECVDLLIVDPPYNLTKSFNGKTFNKRADTDYGDWLRAWLEPAKRTLKATASIYVCSEWRSSGVVQEVLEDLFVLRNRITWEREKGRGALSNWKNASEDIWFCTQSADYLFNVDAVKLRPGRPETESGRAGPTAEHRATFSFGSNTGLSRREWMIQLCDRLLEFYPAEKLKLDKRIARAKGERQRWLALGG